MGVLDRVGFVRANYNSLYAGGSPDQSAGNYTSAGGAGVGGPSLIAGVNFGGFGQQADAQGSVQATGVLIIVLLGLLILAHKKLPFGMGG